MAHRIVIIDQDESSLQNLAALAKECGHNVVARTTLYDDVQSIIAANAPNVICLKISDNVLDSLTLLRQLRNQFAQLTMIVISSKAMDLDTFRCCSVIGILDFLIEPIRLERLKETFKQIKSPAEISERGFVLSAGYTISQLERDVIHRLRMVYLSYPSCHLAIQFLKKKEQSGLVLLSIQENLDMYGNTIRKDELVIDDLYVPPWKQVIIEAQLTYQDYWKNAIEAGLMPQHIPCLYKPKNKSKPRLLPADVIDALEIPLIESEQAFKQISITSHPVDETAHIAEDVAESIGQQLDEVEKEHPGLVHIKGRKSTMKKPSSFHNPQKPSRSRSALIPTTSSISQAKGRK